MSEEFAKLVAMCAAGETPGAGSIDAVCRGARLSKEQFYEAFALHVAQEFAAGALRFDDADACVNWIWGESSFGLSGLAFDVFIAFDDGEYDRSSDPRGTDPVAKYTRPQIHELLKCRSQV